MAYGSSGIVGTLINGNRKVLEMRGISKAFHGIAALHEVDFECAAGEIHALVGENGAGKSTLCGILAGAITADRGEILIGGEPVRIDGPDAALRLGISLAYQEFSLVPHLSVASNIWLHREPQRFGVIDRRLLERKTQALLDELQIGIAPTAIIERLSMSQQQLIEIARAVSFEPRLLIMDEPTSSLNFEDQSKLLALLARLRARGVAIVYVSHRLAEIFRIADRATVLKDGHKIATVQIRDTSHDQIVRLMVGRELELDTNSRNRASTDEVVLEVKDLVLHRHGEPLNLMLRRGEIVGLAGLAGSGRSSLLRALCGARESFGGRVAIAGQSGRMTPRSSARRGVAYLGEDRKRDGLAANLPARTNLNSVVLPATAGLIRRRGENAQAHALARAVQLPKTLLMKAVKNLSGGNQQKVAIARWLAAAPRIILFDEPTRGIDVGAKVEIYALLRRLAEDGTAILFASSEMPDILTLSDRILVMRNGSMTAEFADVPFDEERVAMAMMGVTRELPVERQNAG